MGGRFLGMANSFRSCLRSAFLLFLLAPLLVMAGCVSPEKGDAGAGSSRPGAAKADKAFSYVEANNAFALSMYKLLSEDPSLQDRNFIFSPYALSSTLIKLLPYVNEKTRNEVAKTLHFPPAHNYFTKAQRELLKFESLLAQINTSNGVNVKAVSLFGMSPYYPEGTLTKTQIIRSVYRSDFIKNPAEDIKKINSIIFKETDNKILETFTQDQITEDTLLAVSSSLIFDAEWMRPFFENHTVKAPFSYNVDNKYHSIKHPMMINFHGETLPIQEGVFENIKSKQRFMGAAVNLIELPYIDERLVILFVSPMHTNMDPDMLASAYPVDDRKKENLILGLHEMESYLFRNGLEPLYSSLEPNPHNDLLIPRINFLSGRSRVTLKHLCKLGIYSLCDRSVEYPGAVKAWLRPDKVFTHSLYFQITEQGVTTDRPRPRHYLVAGREIELLTPYMFFVREKTTGIILLSGRIINPEGDTIKRNGGMSERAN